MVYDIDGTYLLTASSIELCIIKDNICMGSSLYLCILLLVDMNRCNILSKEKLINKTDLFYRGEGDRENGTVFSTFYKQNNITY